MLQKYREIVYGVLIGLGAACLDTFIDAQTQENSFIDQVREHPTVMLYRAIFILFGLIIGWLIWRNRRRERDYQRLLLAAEQMSKSCSKQALLINTKMQVLLTRDDLKLPPEAQELLRGVYDRSKELQALVRDHVV